MKKKLLSSIMILMFFVTTAISPSYASYQDEYNKFKNQFSDLDKSDMDDLFDILMAISYKYNEDQHPYEKDIISALDKVKEDSKGEDVIDIMVSNGLLESDNYKKDGAIEPIEGILKAVNEIIYTDSIDGNDYTGASLDQIAEAVRKDGDKLGKETKEMVEKAYEHILDSMPSEIVDKDLSPYGDTDKEKAMMVLKLAKDMFQTGDVLVKGDSSIPKIELNVPSDYISKANDSLETDHEGNKVSKKIVLTDAHALAIDVILDVLENKINEESVAGETISIAKKLDVYEETSFTHETGKEVEVEKGEMKFDGVSLDFGSLEIPKGAKVTVRKVETSELEGISLEAAGAIMDIDLDGITPSKENPIPVKLEVKADNTDKLSIYCYDEENKVWEFCETTIKDKVATAYATHFSIYGVFEDRKSPEKPSISTASATSSSIELKMSSSDISEIKEFVVFKKDGSEFKEIATVKGNAITKANGKYEAKYTNTGLSAETEYTYKVKAVDGLDNTSQSNEFKATTGKASSGGGSGGGGGGGGSSSDDSGTKIKEDKDKGGIEADIGKDAIKVEKKNGQSIVKVDKKEFDKAIDMLASRAKGLEEKDGKVDVVLKLKDVKDMNAKINIPAASLKKLEGKNAEVTIKTDKIEVSIPVANMDLGDEKAEVSLDIKEVAEKATEVKAAIAKIAKAEGDENAQIKVAKVIKIDLSIVSANGEKEIDKKFKQKVTVKISLDDTEVSADKAVVVFVGDDGSIEIVGRKVVDGNVVANLSHFSNYALVQRDVTFEDIKGYWAKEEIESMASKGLVKGYDSKTFNPGKNITRAEFAKLLVEAMELDMVEYKGGFTDLDSHWANGYIQTAYEAGYISGYEDKTFKPNKKITRAEMAAMITRAMEIKVEDGVPNYFDASDIPNWAMTGVKAVSKEKLMNGSEGNFRPNDSTTRGEATAVIYRIFNSEK